jgi:hypothetical protein
VRERDLYPVVVTDSGVSTPSFTPNAPVYADSTVATATVIDSFILHSSSASYVAAIYIDGANLTVTNNDLSAGGSDISYGIRAENYSSEIRSNIIFPTGSGTYTAGIRTTGSGATIEGNQIDAGAGDTSTGIWIEASNCMVTANSVDGSGTSRTAVLVESPSIGCQVTGNTLLAGDGGSLAYGVRSSGAATLTISANTIHGGSASITNGIEITGGSAEITSNSIFGGTGDLGAVGVEIKDTTDITIDNNLIHGGAGSATSNGILSDGSTADIRHNTIFIGSADGGGRGLYLATGTYGDSTITAQNNIIFGDTTSSGSRCFMDEEYSGSTVTFSFNDLYCYYLYYDPVPTRCFLTDGASCLSATLGYTDNVAVDPLLADEDGTDNDMDSMDDNDWDLTMSSPSSVASGGTDLTADVASDYAGTTRTDPVSMGAYEYD